MGIVFSSPEPAGQTGPALYSSIARMQQAASRMPADMQALYHAHFVEGKGPAEVCAELGLTAEEFEAARAAMLRNIRAAVGAGLAPVKTQQI